MNVELKLSSAGDSQIIKNLWPLYAHEVSEFERVPPNSHGVLSDDQRVTTLALQGEGQNPWWREPSALFPYLVLVDGQPAGFHLIAARARLPEGIDADFVVHEFFIAHAYRGQGVGERAACAGFDNHRGQWEVVTYPGHARAIAFWRKVVSRYAPDRHSESTVDHTWGRKVAFRFDNSCQGC